MGQLQDRSECLGGNALEDEISLRIESGGEEIDILNNQIFNPNTVREINKSFMCIDSVTVFIKELDILGNNEGSSRVTCSDSDYFFELEIDSKDCLL